MNGIYQYPKDQIKNKHSKRNKANMSETDRNLAIIFNQNPDIDPLALDVESELIDLKGDISQNVDTTVISDICTSRSQTREQRLNLAIKKDIKDSSLNYIILSSSDDLTSSSEGDEVKPIGFNGTDHEFKNSFNEQYSPLSGGTLQLSSRFKLNQSIEIKVETVNCKEECDSSSSSGDNLESPFNDAISSSDEFDETNVELKEPKKELYEDAAQSSSNVSCTSNDECDNSTESDGIMNLSTLDTLFSEMMDYMKSCKLEIKPIDVNLSNEEINEKCSICDENNDFSSLQSDFSEGEITYMKSCFVKLKKLNELKDPKNLVCKKKFTCHYCKSRFSREWDLNIHIKYAHLKIKPFKCPKCPYESCHRGAVNKHLKRVHLKINKYKCSLCKKAFFDMTELQRRNNSIHDNTHVIIKPYKCEICGLRSASSYVVDRHVRLVHRKERPYQCHYCGYRAGEKRSLSRHIMAVHLKMKPFKCSLCSYRAPRIDTIKAHITAVHKKERRHKCPYCDYRAAIKGTVTTHIRMTHYQEKNHSCDHCGYRSFSKALVKYHIIAVHLRKSYKCTHCSLRYSRKDSLKIHIKNIHPDK